jgi:hypothetical protein
MVDIVTIEAARRQLRLEASDTSRDEDLRDFIADAAAWVQSYTGHILSDGEIVEQHTGRGPVRLLAWPIFDDSTLTVTMTGTDGVEIPIPARLSYFRRPAELLPSAPGWPYWAVGRQFTVTVRAGYQNLDQVPRNFRRAMLILITAYDEDREGGALFQAAEAAARKLCRFAKRGGL